MYLGELSRVPLEKSGLLTPRQSRLLGRLGLLSVADVFQYFPFRFDDRSRIESIEQGILEDRPVTVVATVMEHGFIYYRNRRHPKILVQDEKMRAWLVGFNRVYLKDAMKTGRRYWIHAHFVYKYNEIQASAFDFEEYREGEKPKNFGGIMPVYQKTEQLYLKELRGVIRKVFEKFGRDITDELPDYLVKAHRLLPKRDALFQMHYPDGELSLRKAKLRTAYEEFFGIQLAVTMKRRNIQAAEKRHAYRDRSALESLIRSLPFRFTGAQKRALEDIERDLASPRAMHRLLQGDVGCGKTAVAAAAMALAAGSGLQAALMAPTEVLAEQHYRTLSEMFRDTGLLAVLLTGSTPPAERETVRTMVADGRAGLVVGTHALIQEDVAFRNLSLIVFDEQHKFGVEQRIALSRKGERPDILVMTATPIPRTLTLTLYGDLDLSLIDEMPANRKPVATRWVTRPRYPAVLRFVEQEIEKGRQAYFVYPLIEASAKVETDNAVKMFETLRKHYRAFRLGLLHGRLGALEKYRVVDMFRKREIDILVSTTVIEVGIDVKNASVMVVEGAERFGLSQLHQLRGRVGRGEYPSTCVLVTPEDLSPESRRRMEIMESTQDGFRIAEEDLRMRGPGEILGVRQSGLPELKVADYLRDERLFLVAKEDASNILRDDPDLSKDINKTLREGIINFLPSDYLYSG